LAPDRYPSLPFPFSSRSASSEVAHVGVSIMKKPPNFVLAGLTRKEMTRPSRKLKASRAPCLVTTECRDNSLGSARRTRKCSPAARSRPPAVFSRKWSTEIQIQLKSDHYCNAFAQNEPNFSVRLQALGFWEAGIKRADFRNHGQRLKPENVKSNMRRAAHAPVLIRSHDVGLCCSFRVGRHG
jgi:hypothetical protein